jgi:2-polyprenyl-3-methyl-5-hydroxy-6-metoxy-1,4-benzoquinol methylase
MMATQWELMELQRTLYTSRNPTRRWLHNTRRSRVIAELRRTAASGPTHRSLEVGPGSGVYLTTLAQLYDKVVATDVEEAFLDHARTVAARCPNLSVRRDDITASGLEPQSFDTVLCSEVIEHIGDSHAALDGMYRALRPGGFLVLSTPQRYSPLEVCSRIAFHPIVLPFVRIVYREPILPTGHVNLLTRSEAFRQLRDAGFEILRTGQSGVYIPVVAEIGGRLALRLERRLERRMAGGRLGGLLWVQYYVARRR